jgi:hypothetical protein
MAALTSIILKADFAVRLGDALTGAAEVPFFQFRTIVTSVEELHAALDDASRKLRAAFPLPGGVASNEWLVASGEQKGSPSDSPRATSHKPRATSPVRQHHER